MKPRRLWSPALSRLYPWLTPFNVGQLTVREWMDVQSDVWQLERAEKAAERRSRRGR